MLHNISVSGRHVTRGAFYVNDMKHSDNYHDQVSWACKAVVKSFKLTRNTSDQETTLQHQIYFLMRMHQGVKLEFLH